ncbi:MAG: hypothetical protein ABSA47_07125 [Verrucomicrobiota bacterium]|jgi:hypothetical protein
MKTRQTTFRAATVTAITAALLPITTSRALAAADTTSSPATTPSVQPAAPPEPEMPSGVSEVLKLQKGGVSADIITHYVNNSTLSFYLSADNVIYLQHQGVPAPVITAMIQRNGELQRQTGMAGQPAAPPQQAQAPAATYGYPPENAAVNFNNALQARAANPAFYPTPAPSYPVYYPTYDYYDYYPYAYPYAFDYWPPVYFGLGVGYVGGGFGHGGVEHGGFGGGVGHGGFGGGAGHGGFGGGAGHGGGHR